MKNKELSIPEIKIETWDKLYEYILQNVFSQIEEYNEGYPEIIGDYNEQGIEYFRGVGNAEYDLSSTLERYIRKRYERYNINIDRELFDNISKEYLEYCKRIFRGKIPEQYILLDKDKEQEDEIWFYGQHYGLKTPFLDWTKSFLIALYFAFEEKNDSEYRAIYSLTKFLNNKIEIYEPKLDFGGRLTAQKGAFTKLLSKEIVELNESLKQKFPMDIGGEYCPLNKIIISSSMRCQVMEFLSLVNINATTVYPDIKGAINQCELKLDNILESYISV